MEYESNWPLKKVNFLTEQWKMWTTTKFIREDKKCQLGGSLLKGKTLLSNKKKSLFSQEWKQQKKKFVLLNES